LYVLGGGKPLRFDFGMIQKPDFQFLANKISEPIQILILSVLVKKTILFRPLFVLLNDFPNNLNSLVFLG
jgi:hypothetical protein